MSNSNAHDQEIAGIVKQLEEKLMEPFHQIVNDRCIGDAMSWMDAHGMGNRYAHYTAVADETEANHSILSAFHHAYQDWARDQLRNLLSIPEDHVFPKGKHGIRQFAMFAQPEE